MHGHGQTMQVLCLRLGMPYPALLPPEHDESWRGDARHRGMMVHVGDVARAIACALWADEPRFGVYPIVSQSDAPRADVSAGEEIGWRPVWRFTPDGVSEVPSST